MNPTLTAENGTHVVERGRRFAESLLWKCQRDYFAHEGAAAWRASGVPHRITTNPLIARAYARVVLGWLQDGERSASAKAPPAPRFDLDDPVTIIELGAGTGRFAYHFLQSFWPAGRAPVPGELAIRYVMTDFAEKNLDAWRAHPSLQPYIDSGVLDFALFDAERPEPLRLRNSGDTLTAGSLRNPPVIIANYFFDSIPSDIFTVKAGRLHETRVTLSSSRPEPDLLDPDLISRLTISFEHHPASPCYDDPHANGVLEDYRSRLSEATFLFPCAALRCIRHLRELSGGALLLLSTDKGYDRERALIKQAGPGLALHGSFSVMVNYHAMARYVLGLGGQVLRSSYEHAHLTTMGFVLGLSRDSTACTTRAFEDMVQCFNPGDFHVIRRILASGYARMSVDEILAFHRLSGGDATLLTASVEALIERVEEAPQSAKDGLCLAAVEAWTRAFAGDDEQDLAVCLASLLERAGYAGEAIGILDWALARDPSSAAVRTMRSELLEHLDRVAMAGSAQ
jgi:hypothetical protein